MMMVGEEMMQGVVETTALLEGMMLVVGMMVGAGMTEQRMMGAMDRPATAPATATATKTVMMVAVGMKGEMRDRLLGCHIRNATPTI